MLRLHQARPFGQLKHVLRTAQYVLPPLSLASQAERRRCRSRDSLQHGPRDSPVRLHPCLFHANGDSLKASETTACQSHSTLARQLAAPSAKPTVRIQFDPVGLAMPSTSNRLRSISPSWPTWRQICGGLSLAPVRPPTAYDAGRQRRLIPIIIIIIIEQAPRRPCQVVLGSLVLHRVHNILVHQGRNGRAMSSKRSVQYHHVLDLAFSVRSDAPQRGSVTPRSRGHTVHSRCLAVMHSWK